MLKLYRIFLLYILSLGTLWPLYAQENTLKSPEEFLGYPYASRFNFHHQLVDYVQYLGENSSYVHVEEYGKTSEGRPLLSVIVSSPENLQKKEEIRKAHLQRAGLAAGEAKLDEKTIVWLNFNIHGNESASSIAVLPVLHALATQKTPAIKEFLEELIIIIDPCVNPDGYARYVNWYHQQLGFQPNANPNTREHNEPWPGGRYNHYLFDLNRDWAWQTQNESKLRVKVYREWMPHVHVDFHEMGYQRPYFFGPAAKPIHEDVSSWQKKFQGIVADRHQKYFDENAWLYFTEEVYDLFYPSYGDTYPMFNGAVGFTYEQGGSGSAGLMVDRYRVDTLRLKDRYTHHYTTALSTLESSFAERDNLEKEFEAFFKRNRTNPPGVYKSYVLKKSSGEDKLARMQRLLDDQQIEYQLLKASPKTYAGFEYFSKNTQNFQLEEGDLLLDAYQNQSTLLKVLFEPESKLEDSLTYDLTAWSLPYAYGIETYALKTRLVAETLSSTQSAPKSVSVNKPLTYLLAWQSIEDVKFLNTVLAAKIPVRMAEESFTMEGKTYPRGTLVFLKDAHVKDWSSTLENLAQKHGRKLNASSSTNVSEGPDFGSRSFKLLQKPKVALLSGEGVSATDMGSFWFLFEQEFEMPIDLINKEDLNQISLNSYDLIILPSGNYRDEIDLLQSYIRQGGKVVAIERAIRSFEGEKAFNIKLKKASKEGAASLKKGEKFTTYEERRRKNLNNSLAGAIYRVNLDTSHPLAFGLQSPFFLVKRNSSVYSYLTDGDWSVGRFPKDAHVSGFAGYQVKAKIQESLSIGVENLGRGQVIYFTDTPVFRNFWDNGKLLIANAVFFL